MSNASSHLYSSPHVLHYTTIAANKDLKALDPGGQERPCRRIVCKGAAGNIVFTQRHATANGAGATVTVTMPVLSGVAEDIQALTLVAAGTTATEITVYW